MSLLHVNHLEIHHPVPGDTVVSDFLAAQGDADPAIPYVIGIIWDKSGKVVAVGTTLANPPHWLITFEGFKPGHGYSLEVIDVTTKQRLACIGPFDAKTFGSHGPPVTYPTKHLQVFSNMSAYGSSPGTEPVEGQVTGPNGNTAWVGQSQGPPNTQYWIVRFSGIPLNANFTSIFTVRETITTGNKTDVTELKVV